MAIAKGAAILGLALLLIMFMSFWAAGRARAPLDAAARTALEAHPAEWVVNGLLGGEDGQ